jgi:GNAT superfamily N-acetyltransferase
MVDSAVNTAPSVEVAAIANPSELSSPILRDRAEHATRTNARQYVARIRDKEAGYLSFEDRRDLALGVIYEVFVLTEHRSRGVGATLLQFGEDVARRAGYSRVRLCPRPLDDGISESRLVEWYERCGYRLCQNSGGEMQKLL